MKRSDKIKLLKGLASGETTLQDLQPKVLLHRVGYPGDRYFINDKPASEDTYLSAVKLQISEGETQKKVLYGSYDPFD